MKKTHLKKLIPLTFILASLCLTGCGNPASQSTAPNVVGMEEVGANSGTIMLGTVKEGVINASQNLSGENKRERQLEGSTLTGTISDEEQDKLIAKLVADMHDDFISNNNFVVNAVCVWMPSEEVVAWCNGELKRTVTEEEISEYCSWDLECVIDDMDYCFQLLYDSATSEGHIFEESENNTCYVCGAPIKNVDEFKEHELNCMAKKFCELECRVYVLWDDSLEELYASYFKKYVELVCGVLF